MKCYSVMISRLFYNTLYQLQRLCNIWDIKMTVKVVLVGKRKWLSCFKVPSYHCLEWPLSSLGNFSQGSQCPSQSYICLVLFSGYITPRSHKFHTDSLWIVGWGGGLWNQVLNPFLIIGTISLSVVFLEVICHVCHHHFHFKMHVIWITFLFYIWLQNCNNHTDTEGVLICFQWSPSESINCTTQEIKQPWILQWLWHIWCHFPSNTTLGFLQWSWQNHTSVHMIPQWSYISEVIRKRMNNLLSCSYFPPCKSICNSLYKNKLQLGQCNFEFFYHFEQYRVIKSISHGEQCNDIAA
jgi:hypothetical protein